MYLLAECSLLDRFPFDTTQQSNIVVMLHDAFQPLSTYDDMFQPPGFQGVMLDTHIYQIFSDEVPPSNKC